MKTLHQRIDQSLHACADQELFTIKRGLRRKVWTGGQVAKSRDAVAAILAHYHVKDKQKYIIWGLNSPEWVITFLAGVQNQAVAVPVDARSQWETVERYIAKTHPVCAVVSQALRPFFKDTEIPVLVLEEIEELAFAQQNEKRARSQTKKTVPHNKADTADGVIEILFTSGSSGEPKGVLLTEKNILAQLDQTLELIPVLPKYETVSILPLSHIYEQMYGLFLPIVKGGRVHYLSRLNPLTIRKALKHSEATYLLAVPQMLRLMFDGMLRTAKEQGRLDVFKKLLTVSPHLPMKLRRTLFASVHRQFGGKLELITSGSAPLEPKLAKQWEAMGFSVLEGYGASETSGMVTLAPYEGGKFGTVGRPTHAVEVKLGQEDEILVKGDVVSPGYYLDKKKTAEAFVDGWYRTGDIGKFVDGFLQITGRVSSRIVLSDGTKVYPEDIERRLNDCAEVKDSCVVEQRQGEEVYIHAWVLPHTNYHTQTLALDDIMKSVNQQLESKQQIFSYAVWPDPDFPRLRTRKVDRKKVHARAVATTGTSQEDEQQQREERAQGVEALITSLSGKKKVRDDDALGEDLKLDSLRRIQLAAMVEQYFGTPINEFDITATTTVGQLKKLMETGGSVQKAGHSAEEITGHWRYTPWIRTLRTWIQDLVMFPFHTHYVKLKVEQGGELLRQQRQALIICNHPGNFDVFCTLRLLPRSVRKKLAVAATEERWEDGKGAITFMIDMFLGGYPIGRKGPWMVAGLDATGELVDKGFSILFYPEGEMQRQRKQNPFLPGLGYLAKELRLAVLMVKLNARQYQDIWPPPPPGKEATDLASVTPISQGSVEVRIAEAVLDYSLNSDQLTHSIEEQFNQL